MRRRRGADGLPVRPGGQWTQDKLAYLERYASAFMKAMGPKRDQGKWDRLVYIDLLAGPGRGMDRETGVEFDGSPLRALKVQPAFDHLYLGDLDEQNIDALQARIPSDDRQRVELRAGDCNEAAERVTRELSRRTLGLAFVDPQGFEATFRMFRAFATRRIDILYLFPGGIGVNRNLPAFAKKLGGHLDDLWGSSEWRQLKQARLAAGERLSNEELRSRDQPFVLAFRQRIASLGYQYSDQGEPYFTNEKNVRMYHLLFFSKDPAGLTLWRAVKRIEPSGQRILL